MQKPERTVLVRSYIPETTRALTTQAVHPLLPRTPVTVE